MCTLSFFIDSGFGIRVSGFELRNLSPVLSRSFHRGVDAARVNEPRRLEKSGYVSADWSTLPAELSARLKKAGKLAAVLSPHLTVEEAYLLAKYVKSLDPAAVLALGPIPTEGTDEKFRNGFVRRIRTQARMQLHPRRKVARSR